MIPPPAYPDFLVHLNRPLETENELLKQKNRILEQTVLELTQRLAVASRNLYEISSRIEKERKQADLLEERFIALGQQIKNNEESHKKRLEEACRHIDQVVESVFPRLTQDFEQRLISLEQSITSSHARQPTKGSLKRLGEEVLQLKTRCQSLMDQIASLDPPHSKGR